MTQNELQHFKEFNEQIYKIYDEQNLKNLGQLEFNGQKKGSASVFSSILRRKINIHPLPYSDFKIHDELDFITKDLKYITGVLYFLQPYIIDTRFSGGTYHQNLEDRRYLMYANFGFQSIYNFWDRIGDVLHLYFETGLSADSVYLGKVLNNMKEEYKNLEEYKELKYIYETHLKPFFAERHKAVHHFQLECQHFWGQIEKSTPEKKEKLNEEKQQYPDNMKIHLELCFKGFELAVKLIEHLPDKVSILLKREFIIDKTTGELSKDFKIKELKLINYDSPQKDIIDEIKKDSFLSEEELKDELSTLLNAPKDLICLIEPNI